MNDMNNVSIDIFLAQVKAMLGEQALQIAILKSQVEGLQQRLRTLVSDTNDDSE